MQIVNPKENVPDILLKLRKKNMSKRQTTSTESIQIFLKE